MSDQNEKTIYTNIISEMMIQTQTTNNNLDETENIDTSSGLDISTPCLGSLGDFEPVRLRASQHREDSLTQREIKRKYSASSAASSRMMMNVGSPCFDDRLSSHHDGSISTLESDIKSLQSIIKIDDDEKDAKESVKQSKSDLDLEDRCSINTPPIPIDIEIKPKISSYKTSKKAFSSVCSKNLKLKHPSPTLMLILLGSTSMLSILFCLLLYFSVPLPGVLELEGANLYNNFHFAKSASKEHPTIFAMNKLKDVTMSKNIETDLPFLWLIPHTADISIIDIFGHCYHLSQASNYKEKIYLEDTPFHIVQNGGISFVNVDLFSAMGIDRAIKGGLANSSLADVIISPHLHLMSNVFTKKHQGRLFVLLRNPIERLLDKYVTSFRIEPGLGTMRSFTKNSSENNWLTRQLSNQQLETSLTSEHLEIAKNVLKHKFLIGKVDNIHESFERFKMYFNWKTDSYLCDDQIIINSSKLKNHVKDLNAQELNMIYDSNSFDVQLYSYAEYLFQQQGSQIFGINKFQ